MFVFVSVSGWYTTGATVCKSREFVCLTSHHQKAKSKKQLQSKKLSNDPENKRNQPHTHQPLITIAVSYAARLHETPIIHIDKHSSTASTRARAEQRDAMRANVKAPTTSNQPTRRVKRPSYTNPSIANIQYRPISKPKANQINPIPLYKTLSL